MAHDFFQAASALWQGLFFYPADPLIISAFPPQSVRQLHSYFSIIVLEYGGSRFFHFYLLSENRNAGDFNG